MVCGKDSNELKPLPFYIKFYVYAIQGFCDEIIFTAVIDFIVTGDWALKGHSSLSTFFIYGIICFMVEKLYVILYYKYGVSWHYRVPLYVLIAYVWEFLTGLLLQQFNACPWDYSHYKYHVMGLITPYYAPGWVILAFLQDVLADYLLRLRVLPSGGVVLVKDPVLPSGDKAITNMTLMSGQENGKKIK